MYNKGENNFYLWGMNVSDYYFHISVLSYVTYCTNICKLYEFTTRS